MSFSEFELHKIKKEVGGLCDRRTPEHRKEKLRFEYDIEKQNVYIYEIRPYWHEPKESSRMVFAKLTYVKSRNIWKLYWKRASGKWERYAPKESDKDLRKLVREIDIDSYGCFFG